ncbi:GNAT family N-acetyltransferase [Halovenus amylolytica]|uniref:GNAT family N-acetyltransferase n=1 Tax=Halovenus amylolytica TaxID=2500550 RepID=UPI003D6A890A
MYSHQYEELYVRPGYRNQGFGTRLIQRAESWADDGDCEYIERGVNADNDPARALYESQGYAVRRRKMDRRLNA